MHNFAKKNYFFFLLLTTTALNGHSWFQFISVKDLLKKHPEISYQKCFDTVPFNYQPFSLLPAYPHQGNFLETFILTVPHGKVQSQFGFCFVDNCFIKELIWADQPNALQSIPYIPDNQFAQVNGRVAVITQFCCTSYSHWLNEILGRLALLDMQGIAYDYLYVPYDKPFIRETLQLWGINPAKIIAPSNNPYFCLQAKELIIPSMVINTDIGFKKHIGLYAHPYTLKYVQNKLLTAALQQGPSKKFSQRIFISRKDAPWRKMTNEDEFFQALQPYGFERYELSKMSVIDQILLFHDAEIVIGEHGTGLVNIIYCKPETRVIEIFQSIIDNSFWYLSEMFHLKYQPIKTKEFVTEHMTNWPAHFNKYLIDWKADTYIPSSSIQEIIQSL